MLGFAWLTIRQAQEALKAGRLEEAYRLLSQPDARGHKESWDLLRQVARGFVERGERALQHDDPAAAWKDLLLAEQVGVSDDGLARLRQALVRRGLSEARALLDAGEAGRAGEVLAQLRERGVQQPEAQLLEEAARNWTLARDLAGRGEFALALQAAERARELLPETPAALKRCHAELDQAGKEFGGLLVRLHGAVDQSCWREALQVSEQILAHAPQHAEARKARMLAWKAIEPPTTPAPRQAAEPAPAEAAPPGPPQRYLLWLDGVGGYLICLGTRVTLGQATGDACVDVPLCADVSRLHAALSRDAEGYLLEGLRAVQVNGQAADRALLRDGDRVTLGASCQLQFRQPVPISATARLDPLSGHRLPLALDRVFLMADTLIIGPGPQAHVEVHDLDKPVILYRRKDGLGVRYAGELVVDGKTCNGRGDLGPSARVTWDTFAFSLEPVGRQIGR